MAAFRRSATRMDRALADEDCSSCSLVELPYGRSHANPRDTLRDPDEMGIGRANAATGTRGHRPRRTVGMLGLSGILPYGWKPAPASDTFGRFRRASDAGVGAAPRLDDDASRWPTLERSFRCV